MLGGQDCENFVSLPIVACLYVVLWQETSQFQFMVQCDILGLNCSYVDGSSKIKESSNELWAVLQMD